MVHFKNYFHSTSGLLQTRKSNYYIQSIGLALCDKVSMQATAGSDQNKDYLHHYGCDMVKCTIICDQSGSTEVTG